MSKISNSNHTKTIYIRNPELYDKCHEKLKSEDSSMSEFLDMCMDIYVQDKLKIGCARCQRIRPHLKAVVELIDEYLK